MRRVPKNKNTTKPCDESTTKQYVSAIAAKLKEESADVITQVAYIDKVSKSLENKLQHRRLSAPLKKFRAFYLQRHNSVPSSGPPVSSVSSLSQSRSNSEKKKVSSTKSAVKGKLTLSAPTAPTAHTGRASRANNGSVKRKDNVTRNDNDDDDSDDDDDDANDGYDSDDEYVPSTESESESDAEYVSSLDNDDSDSDAEYVPPARIKRKRSLDKETAEGNADGIRQQLKRQKQVPNHILLSLDPDHRNDTLSRDPSGNVPSPSASPSHSNRSPEKKIDISDDVDELDCKHSDPNADFKLSVDAGRDESKTASSFDTLSDFHSSALCLRNTNNNTDTAVRVHDDGDVLFRNHDVRPSLGLILNHPVGDDGTGSGSVNHNVNANNATVQDHHKACDSEPDVINGTDAEDKSTSPISSASSSLNSSESADVANDKDPNEAESTAILHADDNSIKTDHRVKDLEAELRVKEDKIIALQKIVGNLYTCNADKDAKLTSVRDQLREVTSQKQDLQTERDRALSLNAEKDAKMTGLEEQFRQLQQSSQTAKDSLVREVQQKVEHAIQAAQRQWADEKTHLLNERRKQLEHASRQAVQIRDLQSKLAQATTAAHNAVASKSRDKKHVADLTQRLTSSRAQTESFMKVCNEFSQRQVALCGINIGRPMSGPMSAPIPGSMPAGPMPRPMSMSGSSMPSSSSMHASVSSMPARVPVPRSQ